ncbi:transmembrane protein, conserved [Trypanosoma equiperdum]|uniref:Uncharacterized protein n=2 Tax=Trypanozoon TaxID=39700 RepID=Q4GZ88_TRYB2|nr:hypothetical protein, conserved [Trypanosoma brucei brucei TREU927]CAJ16085.1 hypothetical protein, conserved [Trypanosoma brucei brucei TREU927]SCU73070.1 transmembrane protein, conserved [Trypanosoma equiperdum]
MSLLVALVRVIGFVLFFTALLRVKKTRVRHLPSRRTRVSRHQGETCIWLERLTSAVFDIFYSAMREGNEPDTREQRGQSQNNSCEGDFAANSARREDKSCGGGGGVGGDAWRFVRLIEEHVEALLEDRGIAACATFNIHSLGDKPPIIRAIRVINRTGMESVPPGSAAPATGSGSPGSGDKDTATPSTVVVPPALNANTSTSINATGVKPVVSHKTKLRPSQLTLYPTGDGTEKWHNEMHPDEAVAAAPSAANPILSCLPPLPATAIELEAEVEYAGDIDVRLQADICLARGRRLPVFIRVSDVEYIKAHVRLHATLKHENATMDTQRKPYLQCTLWLESEPTFSFKMSTVFSFHGIRDFFAVPVVAKFLFLRLVNYRMLYPRGAGLSFNIPLPEDVVDGGVYPWFSPMDDVGTVATPSLNSFMMGRGAL